MRCPTVFAVVCLAACSPDPCAADMPLPLGVPVHATLEAQALHANLRGLAPEHVLFGHQDDLAYGVHWRREPGRSDVAETVGSYPAVYGWELGDLEYGAAENLDGVRFDDMRGWILEGYERGAVITVSWHMNNPVTGGDAWDTTPAVPAILPGGSHHDLYVGFLDRFAIFIRSLRTTREGREMLVPIVFRPFHEMNGNWFWWGHPHATPGEFQQLWRFTVHYLRTEAGLENLLYAYSPDVFACKQEYLAWYPGDEYVDVLGFDDYHSVRAPSTRATFVRRLRDVVELAHERDKVAALTETGVETIPDATWWTKTLLAALESDPVARQVAWILVWRNANERHDRPNHFYAPYPGHPSAPDFVEFRHHPMTLFEDDLPDLYGSFPTLPD